MKTFLTARHALLITFQYFTFTNRHTRDRRKNYTSRVRIVCFVVRLNVISFSSISSISEHMPKTGESVYSLAILILGEHNTYAYTRTHAEHIHTSFHSEDTHTFHTHAYVSHYLTRHYDVRTILNDMFSFFIEFA